MKGRRTEHTYETFKIPLQEFPTSINPTGRDGEIRTP